MNAFDPWLPPSRRGVIAVAIPLAAALALAAASGRGRAATPADPSRSSSTEAGSPTLVINEVEYVEPGSPTSGPYDQAEFVELLNRSTRGIDLGDYVLVGINERGGSYRRFPLPAQRLEPGDYFVVCGKADRVPNCDLTVSPDTNTWQDQRNQGPAAIALVKNATGLPADDELVDSVSYNGNTPGGPSKGGTWTETAGVLPGDPGTDSFTTIARVPDGADADNNNNDFKPRCLTPGYSNPPDPAGPNGCLPAADVLTLVVNEIDVTQPITDDREFVEIKNLSPHSQSLDHKVLAAVNVQGFLYHRDVLPSVVLAAGQHFLVCTNTGKVAGCDYVIPNSGNDYWNSSDTRSSPTNAIALMKAPTGKPDGDILIDTISYGGDVPGSPPTGGTWFEEAGKIPSDPPTIANQGLSRTPDGQDNDENLNDFAIKCLTPGFANTGDQTPTGCGQPATRTPSPTPSHTPTATHTPSLTPRPLPTSTATATRPATDTPPPTDTATVLPTRETPGGTPTDAPTKTAVPTDTPDASPTPTSSTAPPAFRVDDAGNEADEMPGDGACKTRRGSCTLRAALEELNATASGPRYELRFGVSGTIAVPSRDPLPALKRGNVLINGMSARPSAVALLHGGRAISGQLPPTRLLSSPLLSSDAPDQVLPAVTLKGPSDDSATHGLVLNGASNVTVQGLEITGFAMGIVLVGGAQDNLIGSDGDGSGDAAEANYLGANLQSGIAIDATSHDNIVRGNRIYRNNWHGIGMARTGAGGNTLTENRITDNGNAAIGVVLQGAQLAPPVIDEVIVSSRTVSGHVARPCLRCKVEVFADPVDEARFYLGTADVEAGTGSWTISNLAVPATDPSITASLTDAAGNTSRLSKAAAIGARWRLVEVPPNHPRALGIGRTLVRAYRLLDENGNPQAGAKIVWSPVDATFTTDENGLVICVVQLDEVAALASQGLAMTVQAVSRADNSVHPVAWHPHMAVARARRVAMPGDVIIDLSKLGDDGIGGTLALPKTASKWASVLDNLTQSIGLAGYQADSQSIGAAYTAAASVELREGQYAWQENMARGGGIYELRAVGETLSGDLEIVAPVEAYNAGQAASACSATPQGATIAGWRDAGRCWVPVPGAAANAPGQGDSAFSAKVNVSIPSNTGFSSYAAASFMASETTPRPYAVSHKPLQTTSAYTLYTVGFDNQPPFITPTLANGAVLTQLPPVLAVVDEALSGINVTNGITVTLAGTKLTVVYDVETREIQVPAANRAIPAGVSGTVTLQFDVRDGFCNRTTVTRSVRASGGTPTSTPPAGGGGGKIIYSPFVAKKAGMGGR